VEIVLDTNVLLAAIAKNNKWRPIYDAFIGEKYILLITTEIYLEYIEKLQEKTSIEVAYNIGCVLETKNNILIVTVSFKWGLIKSDADDNKFADCAIAGNADYLVTNDSDYRILKQLAFPKLNIVTAEEFLIILQKNEKR